MYNAEENRHAIDGYFSELDDATKEHYKGSSYEWFKSAVKATEDRNFITSTLNRSGSGGEQDYSQSPFARSFARAFATNNLAAAASPDNVTLTAFAQSNSTLTLKDIALNGGAYVLDGEGKLIPFDVHGQYTSMSGGGTPMKHPVTGETVIGIPVKTSLNITESVKNVGGGRLVKSDGTAAPLNSSETLADRLGGFGFVSSQEVTPAMMDMPNISDKDIKSTGTVYTGMIYVPAILDQSAVDRYNKKVATAGVDEIKGIDRRYDVDALNYMEFEKATTVNGFADRKRASVVGAPFATAGKDKNGIYWVRSINPNTGKLVQKRITKEQYDSY